jgi:hypothetical protein
VTGAFRDDLQVRGLTPPSGSEILVQLPDGSLLRPIRGIGNVRFGQQFVGGPPSTIESDISRRATDARLQVKSVATLTPAQPTPILITETGDARLAAATLDNELAQIFGSPNTYEGYYFEIDDSDGEPIAIQAAAFRAGVGQRWIRPDLDPRRLAP